MGVTVGAATLRLPISSRFGASHLGDGDRRGRKDTYTQEGKPENEHGREALGGQRTP